MALLTGPDIGRHPELHMSAAKPEVEITFKRKSWRSDSNGYPHIFGYSGLRNGTADIAQHRKLEMSAKEPEVKTGSENNF